MSGFYYKLRQINDKMRQTFQKSDSYYKIRHILQNMRV